MSSSGATMYDHLAELPHSRLRWRSVSVQPESGTPQQPLNLLYRDPIDAIQSLLDRPSLAPHLEYVPRKVWENDEKEDRVYNEIFTGNWAWEMQVRTYLLFEGQARVDFILGSATQGRDTYSSDAWLR